MRLITLCFRCIVIINIVIKLMVGHDAGEEFTFHWWDHLFNKAANSIQVNSTQDGVEVRNLGDTERQKTRRSKKTFQDKSMLYGQFVKGATLSDGREAEEPAMAETSELEEPEAEEVKAPVLIPANEEEIFKKCGGRTAHKGARHGLKLNGKLQRIEQQEQLMLEKLANQKTVKSASQKTGKSANENTTELANQLIDVNDDRDLKLKKKKKKKRKDKCKEKDPSDCEGEESKLDIEERMVCDLSVELSEGKEKKKKKKRRVEKCSEGIDAESVVDNSSEVKKQKLDIASETVTTGQEKPEKLNKKKKKKHKKSKDCDT